MAGHAEARPFGAEGFDRVVQSGFVDAWSAHVISTMRRHGWHRLSHSRRFYRAMRRAFDAGSHNGSTDPDAAPKDQNGPDRSTRSGA
jgi:hypothetical protein